MCTKQEEIIWKYVYISAQAKKAGLRTARVLKMQIIPLPLATALHRSGHMLLYKQFTYNGSLYQAATSPFRIQIKRLDFRPPRAKEGICVDTKGLSLPHYLLCRAAEWKELWDIVIENTVTHRVCRFIQEIARQLSWCAARRKFCACWNFAHDVIPFSPPTLWGRSYIQLCQQCKVCWQIVSCWSSMFCLIFFTFGRG